MFKLLITVIEINFPFVENVKFPVITFMVSGKLPPRKLPPRKFPPRKLPPMNILPYESSPFENYPLEICPQENYSLGKLPPMKSPPYIVPYWLHRIVRLRVEPCYFFSPLFLFSYFYF